MKKVFEKVYGRHLLGYVIIGMGLWRVFEGNGLFDIYN